MRTPRVMLVILGLACVVYSPAIAGETAEEVAHKMMVIANPPNSERANVEKRFAFILPAMVNRCSDVQEPIRAADMLVVVHRYIDQAGLAGEEDLLRLSNNMHRMTMEITAYTTAVDVPIKCSEIWSMYVISRQEGQSQQESLEGVSAIVRALLGLSE